MDTVNRVVNAASTAFWGEDIPKTEAMGHGEEPISGVQGKGIADDPYDAGNREEQPDAPASDANTAPLEPKIDGTPLNNTGATKTDTLDIAGGSSSSDASKRPLPTDSQAEQRNTEIGSKPTQADGENKKEEKAEGETHEHSKANDPHSHVSTEALKGPQGPAPKSAEEFEKEEKGKEAKGKKPAEKQAAEPAGTTTEDHAASGSSQSKGSDRSSGSDKGSGSSDKGSGSSGKQSTMSKMKERLNKAAHPRHGTKA